MAPAAVARALDTGLEGLATADAERRFARFGPNEIRRRHGASRLRVLWRQIRSPLVLLLVFAAIASAVSGEWVDATIVGAILAASILALSDEGIRQRLGDFRLQQTAEVLAATLE